MLEMGHRRIAYVAAYLSHPSYLREEGCSKALREFGTNSVRVVRDSSLLSSDARRREVLRDLRESGISGIFAGFDILARELLHTALAMGLRIPQELSIAGYDDLDFCEYLEVPLTSVRQPVEDQLKMALEILFQKIRQKSPILRHVILPVELKPRKSTGA
jgi:LacI family transcriptional regulator